ncbi:M20 metallopeptidase family protein [Acidaminococcus fermentans]|uniref:M20 metallopeptidase family protein n=1 Tax=Acidaminococcus fermentans TaxID=905 RepID=UPI00242C5422|nr:M20 family metallopeptidase [Acidaminococcus fermentans]
MKKFILADTEIKEAVAFRRECHQYPELGYEETETTEKIRRKLQEWGIPILDTGLKTGLVASIGQGKEPQCIALRADIDALPIQEASGLPFASKKAGIAHCCGHDLHMTALLYAAKLLKKADNDITGRVLLIFQPAEEKLNGSKSVIDTGIFEKYHPQFIIGLHTWPEIPGGTIGIRKGPSMAASDSLKVTVHGKGGHGAHPHKSIDPICITGYILTALQTIVSRNIAPLDSGVITIGKITGGTAPNVIPDKVVLEGTVRSLDPSVRTLIQNRLETLLPSIAEGFGGTCEVEYQKGNPPVINDANVVDRIAQAGKEVLGEDHVIELEKASMGSEDFADYLEILPGALFRIGTCNADEKSHRPLHNSGIVFDEKGIATGAQVLAQTVWDAFQEK